MHISKSSSPTFKYSILEITLNLSFLRKGFAHTESDKIKLSTASWHLYLSCSYVC